MKVKKVQVKWRVHTTNLLHEIADCGLSPRMGIYFQPLNIFKNLLAEVAQRATELNDPELNILMLRLTLYELPNREIMKAIKKQQKLIKK